jgi:hypothetical protein
MRIPTRHCPFPTLSALREQCAAFRDAVLPILRGYTELPVRLTPSQVILRRRCAYPTGRSWLSRSGPMEIPDVRPSRRATDPMCTTEC